MADADKTSEGTETEEVVETVETVEVEETESEASSAGGKKKKGKKKGKKGQPAAAPAKGKKKKKKKKKVPPSIVWQYPRKPCLGPSYSPCPHIYFKHSVADRSKLDQKKYDMLLATPKPMPWKEPPDELQKYKRRPLTPRTECLALPPKRKLAAHLQEFSAILTPPMTENLGALLETNCDLTQSHVVIYPKGTSAETTYYLREWATWMCESFNKMFNTAARLRSIAAKTQDRVNENKLGTKPKTEKNMKLAAEAWKQLEKEIKASAKDWHLTKSDILKAAKSWRKFMKERPDRIVFDPQNP